jgi:hypothetical protein
MTASTSADTIPARQSIADAADLADGLRALDLYKKKDPTKGALRPPMRDCLR